ncbi:MAG: hypothetical protein JKY40_06850 [Gammaproteobacteria bacterium]|nr:hypothetical protein [Gammaproteobacteria bacterium]
MKTLILRNRYTLLLATLIVYMGVLVAEGMITGREAKLIKFENPYFDFSSSNFEGFRERRKENGNSKGRFDDADDV